MTMIIRENKGRFFLHQPDGTPVRGRHGLPGWLPTRTAAEKYVVKFTPIKSDTAEELDEAPSILSVPNHEELRELAKESDGRIELKEKNSELENANAELAKLASDIETQAQEESRARDATEKALHDKIKELEATAIQELTDETAATLSDPTGVEPTDD